MTFGEYLIYLLNILIIQPFKNIPHKKILTQFFLLNNNVQGNIALHIQ